MAYYTVNINITANTNSKVRVCGVACVEVITVSLEVKECIIIMDNKILCHTIPVGGENN